MTHTHRPLDEKKTALAFGLFMAIMHAVWSILVYSGSAQWLMDWIFGLHFIKPVLVITAFNAFTALTLIVFTFAIGAVFGFVFAKVWNWAGKQKYF